MGPKTGDTQLGPPKGNTMGKDKKIESSDSDSDSGPDDRYQKAPAKKAKTATNDDPPVPGDDEPSWHLGSNKWAKVRQFKGRTPIDIREWYVDNKTMTTKPGSKGISPN